MRWLPLILLVSAVAGAGAADGAAAAPSLPALRIDVHLDRQVGVASPLLYGCSLPAPGTPGARALLAELVRNGSFETAPAARTLPLPKPWGKAPGWELRLSGNRRIVVRKALGLKRSLYLVRGRPARDYSLTVFARKIDGPGGLCVLAQVADRGNLVCWTLGARNNRYHILERVRNGAVRQVGLPVPGHIEAARVYRIELTMRGRTLSCFLDGRLIQAAYGLPRRPTGFGFGPADATAEYFDLVVRDTKGRLIYALNDKMEGRRPSIAAEWQELRGPKDMVYYRWDALYPANSYFSQRLEVNRYAEGDAGIRQRGIPLVAGAAYRGRLHLRANSPVTAQVSLRSRDGRVYARHDLPNLAKAWTPYDLTLKAPADDPDAELCVSINAVARARVDRVSLVRADAPPAYGLRREVVAALRRLKPSVLRWPAGSASLHHNWQRGTGPREERPVVSVAPGAADALLTAPADFGTDEFLTLCRDLGAEPILVVNPVLGMRPALYWLEYCNGAATTTRWGKARAANGHPEPYAVRFWAIDPAWRERVKQDVYVETAAKIAKAMREQDPAVRVIIHGAAAMDHAALDDSLRADVAESLSHIARSARLAAAETEGATALSDLESGLKSLRQKNFRIALTDWAPAPSAPGALLTAARALNILARAAGPDAIATCAAAAPAEPSPRRLVAAPPAELLALPAYELLRLFRAHPLGQLVAVDARLATKQVAEAAAPVDIVAGRSGRSAVVRLVHHGDRPLRVGLVFAGLGKRRLAAKALVWRLDGSGGAGAARRAEAALARARLAITLAPKSIYLIAADIEGE